MHMVEPGRVIWQRELAVALGPATRQAATASTDRSAQATREVLVP
jgi:hypothetical protein